MAAAARPRKGPFSNCLDRGCGTQHPGQAAAGEAFGLLRSLQNHFRCASAQASLSKPPLPEPPLPPAGLLPRKASGEPRGSVMGGRWRGHITSGSSQEAGAAVTSQT